MTGEEETCGIIQQQDANLSTVPLSSSVEEPHATQATTDSRSLTRDISRTRNQFQSKIPSRNRGGNDLP